MSPGHSPAALLTEHKSWSPKPGTCPSCALSHMDISERLQLGKKGLHWGKKDTATLLLPETGFEFLIGAEIASAQLQRRASQAVRMGVSLSPPRGFAYSLGKGERWLQ